MAPPQIRDGMNARIPVKFMLTLSLAPCGDIGKKFFCQNVTGIFHSLTSKKQISCEQLLLSLSHFKIFNCGFSLFCFLQKQSTRKKDKLLMQPVPFRHTVLIFFQKLFRLFCSQFAALYTYIFYPAYWLLYSSA